MLLRGGYKAARQRVIDEFERTYLEGLVDHFPSLAAMSRASGMSPQQVRALLEKHGLRVLSERAAEPR
jgi:hypothetical protein